MFQGGKTTFVKTYFGTWEYLKAISDNRPLKLNTVQTGKIKIARLLKMSWWHCVPAR